VSVTPRRADQAIPSVEPTAVESAAIDRSLVRGLAWTGGVNVATQALRWAITLFIARILSPGDYGLVGMALVYTGFVQLVNEFGLGAAIIQQRDIAPQMLARISGFAMLFGVGLFGLSAAMSTPIAMFFAEPAVRNVVIALGLKFIIDSAGMVSRALLSRDLQYRTLAAVDGVEAVVLAVSTLLFALAGAAYWSLVLGTLCGAVAGTGIAIIKRPFPVAWPGNLRDIQHSIRVGRDIVISRIAWYSYSNADFIIVGRVLDKTALGLYTFAWNIASIPVEKVAALVGRVTPGVFSAVQRDVSAMRRYFLSLTEAIAFVTLPMSAGFVLVADELVSGLLGEKWRPAVGALKILAAYAAVRSISTLPAHVMVMRGRADLARRCSIIAAIILPISFLIGSRWGIVGVAASWVFGYPICITLWDYRYVFKLLDLDVRKLAAAVWPAISTTAVMVMALLAVRAVLPDHLSHLARLGVLVAVGAIVYAGAAFVMQGERVRAFLAVARASSASGAA
jgi:teichuronic acid exporter